MPDAIDAHVCLRVVARRGVEIGFVLLALMIADADAATIAVGVRRHAGAIEIEASTLLKSDVRTAWSVLTDYDRYVDFIPDLRMSRVVARRDGTVTVEQSGDATLWLLRIPLEITFEIAEFPPIRLQSRAIAGSLRSLDSSYLLTPAAAGVRLEYAGRIATGFEVFGPIEQLAVEENIARQFQALADAIEQRSAAGIGPPRAAVGGK